MFRPEDLIPSDQCRANFIFLAHVSSRISFQDLIIVVFANVFVFCVSNFIYFTNFVFLEI